MTNYANSDNMPQVRYGLDAYLFYMHRHYRNAIRKLGPPDNTASIKCRGAWLNLEAALFRKNILPKKYSQISDLDQELWFPRNRISNDGRSDAVFVDYVGLAFENMSPTYDTPEEAVWRFADFWKLSQKSVIIKECAFQATVLRYLSRLLEWGISKELEDPEFMFFLSVMASYKTSWEYPGIYGEPETQKFCSAVSLKISSPTHEFVSKNRAKRIRYLIEAINELAKNNKSSAGRDFVVGGLQAMYFAELAATIDYNRHRVVNAEKPLWDQIALDLWGATCQITKKDSAPTWKTGLFFSHGPK